MVEKKIPKVSFLGSQLKKFKISKSALQSESGRDVLDANSIDKKVIFIAKLPSTY